MLPCAYFGSATTPPVLDAFYSTIAERSSLPIVVYNFPGVCNGVDLDSDFISQLARRYANVVGVKLTCGSVAKITRLAASLSKANFTIFGGQSDFLIGGLSSGSSGCIAAFANVFPKTISHIYTLYREGKIAQALALHQKAALAEQSIKAGIAATKYAAAIHSATDAGIREAPSRLKPRHPYLEPTASVKDVIRVRLADVAKIERSLSLANPHLTAKI